jgi:hypothetical protein
MDRARHAARRHGPHPYTSAAEILLLLDGLGAVELVDYPLAMSAAAASFLIEAA